MTNVMTLTSSSISHHWDTSFKEYCIEVTDSGFYFNINIQPSFAKYVNIKQTFGNSEESAFTDRHNNGTFWFAQKESTSYLYSGVTTQIEVKFCGMCDADIDGCTSRNVTTATNLVLPVGTEESRVMPLLYDDERYTRLISHLQFHTGLAHSTQLM